MYIKILILLLILIPTVNAWKARTHENIVEYIYLNLPEETKSKLNLTKLKEGAVIPDKEFKDFRSHHYPKSFEKSKKWLENETDLSLNIGIAAHYITDSFSAPHTVSREDYYDHSQFEKQVEYYYPKVKCKDYGFSLEDLHIVNKNSKDWYSWLETREETIPEKEVDESTEFLFSIIIKKLNSTCMNINTIVTVKPYITKKKVFLSQIVLVFGVLVIKLLKN